MREYRRGLARKRLYDAGLCTVCKQPQPPERAGKRQKCLRCQRAYAKQNMALLSAGADLPSAQIERRIEAAYQRIQAERRAGLRPGVEQYAWARTYDPVQAANSGAAAGPVDTKHAAQAVSPKAPRRVA